MASVSYDLKLGRGSFERYAQLATQGMDPASINRELAKLARDELAKAIAAGEASSNYDRFVNGVKDAPEESVKAPGPITYIFSYWEPIIKFALDYLRKHSPPTSGKGAPGSYREKHMVMLGSQYIDADVPIAAGETVTIVNTQPYARKIEVGFQKISVPDAIYLMAENAINKQFGGRNSPLIVRFKMINIPNGYVLKGRFRRGYKKFARQALKRDTKAGAVMTYPAIEMTMDR